MLSGNTLLNQEFSSTPLEKFWKHLVSVLETMMGLNKHTLVSEGRQKRKRKEGWVGQSFPWKTTEGRRIPHPYLTQGAGLSPAPELLCLLLGSGSYLPNLHFTASFSPHIWERIHLPPNKICHCFHCFPFICHEVMGLDAKILVFWMLSFKPTFHSSPSLYSRGSLVLHFLP